MRGGRVVKIRVNPVTCMAAIDTLNKVGVLTPGMSFAQVVSSALWYLSQAAIDSGQLPKRDGFEYEQLMAKFPDQPHLDRSRKLGLTNTYRLAEVPQESSDTPFSTNPRIAAIERQIAEYVALDNADLGSDGKPLNPHTDEIAALNAQLANILKEER